MTTAKAMTTAQHEIWNGAGGQAWVAAQDLLDQAFAPLGDVLVEAIDPSSTRHVLDVGCGTGSTTVAVARRLGEDGRCTGIDISEPMLDAARARADRAGLAARFIRADAQTHRFEPESLDRIVSRFGVMFFSDPVRAFTNLRGGVRDGARLHGLAWRDPDQNPFMTAAERAAEPLLPGVSERSPNEPGQFAWARRSRIHDILDASGWREIEIAPLDVRCAFPAADLELYVTRLGPVGRRVQSLDADTAGRVVDAVLPAFEPYREGDEIHFTAACWEVEARAGA